MRSTFGADERTDVVAGASYRHYKNGKLYQVVGVALQTETEELLVIYKPLYENEYEYFARPYDMFVGVVEYGGSIVNRFQKVV